MRGGSGEFRDAPGSVKIRHIVVCIDFAPPSESALREAERIAAQEGAELTALHVIDANVVDEARSVIPTFTQGDAIERAQAHLDEWIQKTAEPGSSVKPAIALGHPLDEIVKAVEEHDADLLVMGSKGVSHRNEVAGFIAAKCVRKAPSKVLLVREGHSGPFEKIVACVDFSETSDRAIEQALHMARQDGAKLELIHVVRPLQKGLVGMEYLLPKSGYSEISSRVHADLESEMQARLNRFPEEAKGVDVDFRLIEDAGIGGGVIRYLNEANADLVVLGTRGRTGLKRLLMGTVAEKVVHGSHCSVLAIKPKGFTFHHVTA